MTILFKQEFTDAPHWMHLDIAGVGGVVDGSDVPYLAKGMNTFSWNGKTER